MPDEPPDDSPPDDSSPDDSSPDDSAADDLSGRPRSSWPPASKRAEQGSGGGAVAVETGEAGENAATAEPGETAEPGIDYPRLAHEALRQVPRLALEQVLREGLPGDHHFYISFKTTAPGVRLPPFLVDLHPAEMTIVLQHQFWDLGVDREAFSVTVAFGGSRHSLTVPYAALTTFVDPSVPFGLRWEEAQADAEPEVAAGPRDAAAGEPEASDSPPGEPGKVLRPDRFRRGGD